MEPLDRESPELESGTTGILQTCGTPAGPFPLTDHLMTSEKDLFSFLALLTALFSIKVLSGFFFSRFRLSVPLLMTVAPPNLLTRPGQDQTLARDVHSAVAGHTNLIPFDENVNTGLEHAGVVPFAVMLAGFGTVSCLILNNHENKYRDLGYSRHSPSLVSEFEELYANAMEMFPHTATEPQPTSGMFSHQGAKLRKYSCSFFVAFASLQEIFRDFRAAAAPRSAFE